MLSACPRLRLRFKPYSGTIFKLFGKICRISSKIPSFMGSESSRRSPFSSPSAAESCTQKLERIPDQLLSLNKIERHDYSILYRQLGLDRWGFSPGLPVPGIAAEGGAESVEEAKEKTAFDVKLEKFDSAAKIKVIREVRTFTDLGLKEAKEMVEEPVVLKKGVTKEEAEQIVAKLKEAGATAVLE